MVGGKMINLKAGLAKDWSVSEIGPQTGFEDSQVAWIGKPFTDEGKAEAARAGGGGQ
jgi:hypothetical protein